MKYQKQRRFRRLAKLLMWPSAVLLVVLVLFLTKIQKRESVLWQPTPALAMDAGQLQSKPDCKEADLAHSMQLLRDHPAVYTLQVGGTQQQSTTGHRSVTRMPQPAHFQACYSTRLCATCLGMSVVQMFIA
jgi:hypothetical protein